MLGVVSRKCVPACTIGDKKEIQSLGRFQHGFDGGATWIGDWRWREPIISIGIIGVVLIIEFAPKNGTAERALTGARSIDDCGVRLQPHAFFQTIEIDSSNAGA